MSRRRSVEEHFWSNVNKTDTCWLWIGGLFKNGYGRFSIYDDSVPAHRMAWTLAKGDPGELFVLHKPECSNRHCVNYESHLYLGTHQDNMDDLKRSGNLAGSNNPRAVLTLENVKEILERYQPYSRGRNSQQALADEFGVARSTISWVTKEVTWRTADRNLLKE